MVAEYIDREALLKEINDKMANIGFTSPYQDHLIIMIEGMERIRDSVEDAPAADVAPVVRGRWITTNDNWTLCSECKTLGSPQWKGCPVCLARMDGE